MRHRGSKFDNVIPILAIAIFGVVLYRMTRAQKMKMASTGLPTIPTATGPVPISSPYAPAASRGIYAPLPG